MKRFLVTCSTYWCGTDCTYSAIAESASDPFLVSSAAEAAYDNYMQYDFYDTILESEGYDSDNMSEEDKSRAYDWIDESQYYTYDIEEYTGDDDDFNSYPLLYDYRIEKGA